MPSLARTNSPRDSGRPCWRPRACFSCMPSDAVPGVRGRPLSPPPFSCRRRCGLRSRAALASTCRLRRRSRGHLRHSSSTTSTSPTAGDSPGLPRRGCGPAPRCSQRASPDRCCSRSWLWPTWSSRAAGAAFDCCTWRPRSPRPPPSRRCGTCRCMHETGGRSSRSSLSITTSAGT